MASLSEFQQSIKVKWSDQDKLQVPLASLLLVIHLSFLGGGAGRLVACFLYGATLIPLLPLCLFPILFLPPPPKTFIHPAPGSHFAPYGGNMGEEWK